MWEEYNGPWPQRTYSAARIYRELGTIPADAQRLRLPASLERLVGEFYIVNQMDKYRINGNVMCQVLLAVSEAAKRRAR